MYLLQNVPFYYFPHSIQFSLHISMHTSSKHFHVKIVLKKFILWEKTVVQKTRAFFNEISIESWWVHFVFILFFVKHFFQTL